ncbi:MAG TPA: tetratricopeptide repeat protein [Candidatus Rifleibacterium sp.]|nr:tetratricopeptide repeat protein [Candidatus Rifleibacterium sp.]
MRKLLTLTLLIALFSITTTSRAAETIAGSVIFRFNQYAGGGYPWSGAKPVYPGQGNQGGQTSYPGSNGAVNPGSPAYPGTVGGHPGPAYPGTPGNPGTPAYPGNATPANPGNSANPGSLSDYQFYSYGHSKYASGNFNAAVTYFDQLLRQYPGSQYADDASFWRARIRFEQKNHLVAINLFSNFVRAYPTSQYHAEAMYSLAQCEKSFGRIQAANLSHLRDAIYWFVTYQQRYPQSPNAAEALFQAGDSCEISGDYSGSKSYYYQVINLYPNSAAAYKAREKLSGRY